MATVGNNLNFQATAGAPMSETNQAIVRSGVGLFELRLPYRSDRDKQVFGPFGVKVGENSDNRFRTTYNREWLTKGNNLINYAVDNKGNGIAWMPDDPWWHNRIFLMDSPKLNPVALHTNKGIINGVQVDIEIETLRKHLKEEKTIYEVVKDKKRLEFYSTEAEAKEAIEEYQELSLRTDKTTGAVITVAGSKHKYSILPSVVIDYKPSVIELIRKYRNLEYGWTSCQEFQQTIKPAIIADVKKAIQAQPVSTTASDLARALLDMNPAEREAIRKSLLGGLEAPPAQVIEQVDLSTDLSQVSESSPEQETTTEPVKRKGGRPRKKAVVEVS